MMYISILCKYKDVTRYILSYLRNVDKFHFILGNTILYKLYKKTLDPSEDDNRAIIWVIENNNLLCLRKLLKNPRTDPGARDNYCIMYAVEHRQTNYIPLLEDPRVDPSVCENYCIREAPRTGYRSLVKMLLKDPRVDPSARENEALINAVRCNNIYIVKLLLKDPRVDPSALGCTPFIVAAAELRVPIVKLLLKDPRVDPSAGGNEAIRMVYKHNKNIYCKERKLRYSEIVTILLNDSRVKSTISKTLLSKIKRNDRV